MRGHPAHTLFVALGEFAVHPAHARVPRVQSRGPLFGRAPPIIAQITRQGPTPRRRIAARPTRVANGKLSTISPNLRGRESPK
jgi:hypothetical protein